MDALFFDVGGVLLVPDPRPSLAALETVGLSLQPTPEQVLRAHYLGVRALDSAGEAGSMSREYLDGWLVGLGLPAERLDDAREAALTVWGRPSIDIWRVLVPGSIDGLRGLHAADHRLAIISNADGTVEAQLRQHRVCQVGEGAGVPVLAIVDSGVVGLVKPDPRIFHHAADLLGVPPARSLYVGDTLRYDIAGAAAAGVRPVHFDPFDLCPRPTGHEHVGALAEVADLL